MKAVSFVKQHKLATAVLFGTGMIFGPWVSSKLANVGVNTPTY